MYQDGVYMYPIAFDLFIRPVSKDTLAAPFFPPLNPRPPSYPYNSTPQATINPYFTNLDMLSCRSNTACLESGYCANDCVRILNC